MARSRPTPVKLPTDKIYAAVLREQKKARVRALDISLNELLSMYKTKELQIRPEYQRLFRWSTEKESQLVESIVLEMPIPPIYVIESASATSEHRWELIDGLQRFSTYMHLQGELDPEKPDEEGDGKKLKLTGCDILPELNRSHSR